MERENNRSSMTIAEIHGKSPNTRSEDKLTADVFTAFKYLSVEVGILGFLRTVDGLGDYIPDSYENADCSYYFWPLGDLREPDVLLALTIDGQVTHVVVEAKYHSGLSNKESVEFGEEDEEAGMLGHQLADELRDLDDGFYRIFKGHRRNRSLQLTSDVENRFLLYLTAHTRRPVKVLKRAADFYEGATGKIFWSSWYHVSDYLELVQGVDIVFPYNQVLSDICFLFTRKHFSSFKGFGGLPDLILLGDSGFFWEDARDEIVSFNGVEEPDFSIGDRKGKFFKTA